MEEFERAQRRKRGQELTDAVTATLQDIDDAVKGLGATEYIGGCSALMVAGKRYREADAALRAFVEGCA